jgi:hypothetical protein
MDDQRLADQVAAVDRGLFPAATVERNGTVVAEDEELVPFELE